MSAVNLIKRFLPPLVLEAIRKVVGCWRRARAARRTRRAPQQYRSPAEVFSEVYANNVWGGERGELYSGSGSADAFTGEYREVVRALLAMDAGPRLTLVDLGCGDFRVGRRLLNPSVDYVGVDVVPSLIEHNQRAFGADGVTFLCLDIVEDELPAGDVCLIRQVFQHLSNKQIAQVLPKLAPYSHVLVTEHHFVDGAGVTPNLDKPHGSDTRLEQGSAVYLDRPPFSVPAIELVLTVPVDRWTELRTFRLGPSL